MPGPSWSLDRRSAPPAQLAQGRDEPVGPDTKAATICRVDWGRTGLYADGMWPTIHTRSIGAGTVVVALASCQASAGGEPFDPGTLAIAVDMPEPLVKGRNRMFLEVASAEGTPIVADTIEMELYMPAHGHGSTETPQLTPVEGPGYLAEPVTFQMSGAWEITITAVSGDEFGVEVIDVEIE
ncbi:MAG: hypothetical protein B7733_13710 [Myxococcales bacterium FL481]|nr:MAG: hypothetical protein B7733_13710 [Myxococcales bacterium FL481]